MKRSGVFRVIKQEGSVPALLPADDKAQEIMRAVKHGADVLVNVHAPRNIKQHNLAWALATVLADSSEYLHDAEDAMYLLKVKARHVKMVVDPSTGEVIVIPKSISFASCDQVQFGRIFDRFVWIIVNELIKGINEEALREQLIEMVSTDRRP